LHLFILANSFFLQALSIPADTGIMTIHKTTSTPPVDQTQSAQTKSAATPKPATPPQDSVHLSAAAKAASADADHDGDSH
jgi:hypothetical protein